MLRVGLTGGIGSGKSAAAAVFRALGCPTLDLDLVARQVTRPGQPSLDLIAEQFSPDLISADGELDHARLGDLVFADTKARTRLEQILHPAIWDATEEWTRAQSDRPDHPAVVMLEIPLLFEAGLQGSVDRIVLVTADTATRLQRVVSGRGMTEEEAKARIAAQLPDEAKRPGSHYVLENDESLDDLQANVEAVWKRLLDDVASSKPG